jgi:hypothetical protein
MYKYYLFLFFVVHALGCTEGTQPSVEINFASIVGKYTGNEVACSTNTGDTLCSGNILAQYNVILRTATNIQLNPVTGNVPTGLFIYESTMPNNNQVFIFKNSNGMITYDKSLDNLRIFSGGESITNFIMFDGSK